MGTEGKTTEQRLQELLDQKDAELAEANERLQLYEDAQNWAWCRPEWLDEDLPGNLPLPRLEIRYTNVDGERLWEAIYAIVFKHFTGQIQYVPMGLTKITGPGPSREEHGKFAGHYYGPYREGAHIRHDMKQLGLPGFIIVGDDADPVFDPPQQT